MDSFAEQRTITAYFDSWKEATAAADALRTSQLSGTTVQLLPEAETTTRTDHKGFFEKLGDHFLPTEDRSTYAEGFRRGGYMVAVTTTVASAPAVYNILETNGAVDLDKRETEWRNDGWTAETLESSSTALGGKTDALLDASTTSLTGDTDEVISVVEERLVVGKRDVSHGRVRIRSYVREVPVTADVSLRNERVSLERRPVDRAVSATDLSFQDRTIEAEEFAEEAVIEKEARVVEEVALRKDVNQETRTISDTVKKTEVEIEDERGSYSSTQPAATPRKGL